VEGFQRLAEQNLRVISKSGAQRIIVSSPEDYHTLSSSYGEYFGELDFEVCHISEIVSEHLSDLRLNGCKRRMTFHDPCRLGRGMGVYDAPRHILGSIPGVELVEMEHTRELSRCCGVSCWTNCNRYSKLMQVNRLQEAAATGADLLVTSCWECAMHFSCTVRPSAWQQVQVEIVDLIALAGSLLQA
jgi:Fe-S oxidoreductase